MTFLDRLDLLMATAGLNKSKLSQLSGVPYTTIDAFYKKGYQNAKISTLRKLAVALGVSLDYLIVDETTENDAKIHPLPPEALAIAAAYNRADEKSRRMARLALEDFMETPVPAMATPHVERIAEESRPITDTERIMDAHWRENLILFPKKTVDKTNGGVVYSNRVIKMKKYIITKEE
ncbi:MAG: helix-turn-helix domain-containing protein, partial [Oscillibacter sp.]|nr:helix-turn-helix domain-containing protein [Oscillibacter sp.]